MVAGDSDTPAERPRVRPEQLAAKTYELAIAAVMRATDQNGLRISMMPVSTGDTDMPLGADFYQKIEEHLKFMRGCQFAGPAARMAFARNLALLSNAWACAIYYEQETTKK